MTRVKDDLKVKYYTKIGLVPLVPVVVLKASVAVPYIFLCCAGC